MRIRVMTDLHYALHANPTADLYYREYLNRFFREGPEADLYVSLGDLTQNGTEQEYRAVYKIIDVLEHRASFIHIPGNHDLLAAGAVQTESWGSTPPITGGFGSMEADLATLVFLNTSQTQKPSDWGGRLDDVQLKLLRDKLTGTGGMPVLIFAHHPLPDTTALSDKNMMRVEEAAALMRVMNESRRTGLWFNGHNHIHSIVRKGLWTYVQTASAICLPCWREVVLSDGAVTVETRVLNDKVLDQLSLESLNGFGSFHRVSPAKAAGTAEDQSAKVRWEHL
jgi:Icc protein